MVLRRARDTQKACDIDRTRRRDGRLRMVSSME
jgi:hypothetical protein